MASDQRMIERKLRIWAPRLLTITAVVLLPWLALLTAQLHDGATRRSLGSSWIGLDIIEISEFLVLAAMLRRRHRATGPFAAATATTLLADAWFDMMSASPRLDYALSILLATLGELPLAALLVWVAARSLNWADQ